MSDLLKQMLDHLPISERIKFLEEVYRSLPIDDQSKLMANLGAEPKESASITQVTPAGDLNPDPIQKTEKVEIDKAILSGSLAKSDDESLKSHFTMQFESERKAKPLQILGCVGYILASLILISALGIGIRWVAVSLGWYQP